MNARPTDRLAIAIGQLNPTVGDITGNCRKILEFIDQAKSRGAKVVVFPELSVIGYPPKDLLLKPRFIEDNIDETRFRVVPTGRGYKPVIESVSMRR